MAAFAQGRPEAAPFDASRITMQPPPPEGVAIRAGRLFDPRTGTNLANQVILIQGDRIADVGPADRVKIPAGARVIDLSNATVLPGLIDRHVHLIQDPEPNEARALIIGQHYALADLYAGFTTLQDMDSPYTYATVELRDAINKGLIVGPRLQVAGPADRSAGRGVSGAVGNRSVRHGPGHSGLAKYAEREFAVAGPRRRARPLSLRHRLDQDLRNRRL